MLVAFALPKVTVPDPLTLDHVVVNVPDGRPSSLAVPLKIAEDGNRLRRTGIHRPRLIGGARRGYREVDAWAVMID